MTPKKIALALLVAVPVVAGIGWGLRDLLGPSTAAGGSVPVAAGGGGADDDEESGATPDQRTSRPLGAGWRRCGTYLIAASSGGDSG